MSDAWKLVVKSGAKPFFKQIADALERDIQNCLLANGTRLPTQRKLANQLGLSVGTITKAYYEAEARGLVKAYVGRGTFVIGSHLNGTRRQLEERIIDLSLCVIPHLPAAQRFAEDRGKFTRFIDLFEVLSYAPPAGLENERRASAKWLREIANIEIPWQQIIVTTGSQHAMALAFGQICKRGDTILCEAEPYSGMKALAQHRGYRLFGLELDDQGVVPNGLETAILNTGANVIYLMPSVQNPTGCSMDKERRQEIAKIARKHKLWVIEDDSFALFRNRAEEGCVPISALIPGQSFYIGTVSKALAPGLRLGFLGCPPGRHIDAILRTVRATVYSCSALGGLLFSQWVEDGSAFKIADRIRDEILRRIELAHQILGPRHAPKGLAPHLWIPRSTLGAENLAGRALRAGVAVSPHTSPLVNGHSISGIRVCLGAASNSEELAIGLRRLKGVLHSEDGGPTAR